MRRERGRERAKTDKMASHAEIDEAEVQKIKSYIQGGDLSDAYKRIKDYFETLKNVPLNIAVTGESGTGKSSFVNTFLELSKEDAAPVGVVETTMKSKAYSHPKYKNVKYWDLPGIGTPNFKAVEYLHKVNFKIFDFFIIIASERFRECNLQLAREIQTMGKKFYFVRSKIRQDVSNCKRQKGKSFNEKAMLEEIREDCLKCFREGKIDNPKVFLLDSDKKGKYDYDVLQETIKEELPVHKRHAFLLSLSTMSLSVLKQKKEAFEQDIWKKATLSAAVAAVPIPGLGIACDLTLLVTTMGEYQTAFGLDEGSLIKLSQLSKKSLRELKSVIKSPHVTGDITKEIVIKIISKGTSGAVMVAEMFISNIPLFGSVVAGGLSFVLTRAMLTDFLFESAEDAERVLIKAFGR